jgi:poly(A) polymerase Pap1
MELIHIEIAMVLLSRFLKYSANRWANVIAGVFHTAFVAWSMIGETPALFYVFFASIEIVCTLFIAWYAWSWRNPEGQPVYQSAREN